MNDEASDFRFLRGFLTALEELPKQGYKVISPEEAAQELIDQGFRRPKNLSVRGTKEPPQNPYDRSSR